MARAALTGTRIRERRAQLGIKQAGLARSVGVSPAFLNLIEHNRRRVSDTLLASLAEALGTQPAMLAEGAESALFDGLREAAAETVPATLGDPPEIDRIEEFASRFPGWAALLSARQARVASLERTVEALSDRMRHDPYLSDSLHEVLSALSSVRSTAGILAETDDIDVLWRARFHANLRDDSERLARSAETLVAYLDAGSGADDALSSPQEELEAWLTRRDFRVPELEPDAPPSIRRAPAAMVEGVPELASAAARQLALGHLERAAAEARALPAGALAAELAETGIDPARLAERFGLPLLTVFRRLASLPPQVLGVPCGLVICDGAGALTFRKPIEGFALPRFGAACPLWPLYQALSRPTVPVRAGLQVAGRLERRFLAYAYCQPTLPAGFDGPQVLEAGMLILPADGPLPLHRLAVGSSCRVCPRSGCPARREPSILREAD